MVRGQRAPWACPAAFNAGNGPQMTSGEAQRERRAAQARGAGGNHVQPWLGTAGGWGQRRWLWLRRCRDADASSGSGEKK